MTTPPESVGGETSDPRGDGRSLLIAESQDDRLRSSEWLRRYSTSRNHLVSEFYEPALRRAVHYDRAVGYFRSSFFGLTGIETARFAQRGGTIRMICSPELTEADVEGIRNGLDARDIVNEALRAELERVLEHPASHRTVELLAALIATSALQIKLVVWRDAAGIFHDKLGVFSDAHGDAISFTGSINESWHGWHPLGNHESFEVFKSWDLDGVRVDDHRATFDSLWNGLEPGLDVFDPPEAFERRLLAHAPDDPTEAIAVLAERPKEAGRKLFEHQDLALSNWVKAGRRGILDHATGSGKTITALHAIRDWLSRGNPALVVVPSTLLLEQWSLEAEIELRMLNPNVLLVGAGHDKWRDNGLLALHTERAGGPALTIATLQTASTDEFLSAVADGDHLLLVADEVHRAGSGTYQAVFKIEAGARLGLSATPTRFGDPGGTAAISAYFGEVLEPRFSLEDAIAAGRLTPYEYFIHLVHFDDQEEHEWIAQTEKVREAFARTGGRAASNEPADDYLKHLLIRRARIAKKASAKVPTACELIAAAYRTGEHWLVYCEDQVQLREMLDCLREGSVEANEYHSAMVGDRDATLDRYRRHGGVLVSIRCLDEGVDIPTVTHAVILASSRNRREFIQRRGRVLRKHPGKVRATIHDMIIAPPDGADGFFDSLVAGEIARAAEFARGAINRGSAVKIERLCIEWGLGGDHASGTTEEESM